MSNIVQKEPALQNLKIGISQSELFAIGGTCSSNIDGFIERYRDFIKSPAQEQLAFAEDMFKLIATDTDTSFVTVAAARCGVGKSITLRALASYFCTYDNYEYRQNDAIGMIIVTDKLTRLKEYQDTPQHVQSLWGDYAGTTSIDKYSTYISSDSDTSAMNLLIQSQYKPIVFLTTQRYFSMPDEQRNMLFDFFYVDYKKVKTKHRREILIFDEKPYFFGTMCIDVKNFNDVSTALQNGIPESTKTSDDKDFILREYRKFRDKMEKLLRDKEKTPAIIDRFYWSSPQATNLTSDDKRFFELIEKYKTSIAKEYQNALTDLRAFKDLMQNGAFFTTSKKNQNQEYKTFLNFTMIIKKNFI